MTLYELTQKYVRRALANAYTRSANLYQLLRQLMDDLWEEFYEELLYILDEEDALDDLAKFPAKQLEIAQVASSIGQRMDRYSLAEMMVLRDIMIESYQQASKDVYRIMRITPVWKDETKNIVERHTAQVRITDTYITDHYLRIPWCADGKTYSDRIYGHVANFRSKLDYVLREGVQNGKGMEWMKQAWRQLTNASAYDTARLIKTETMAMYNLGLKDTYLEAGVEYVEIVGDAECGGICLDYVDGEPIRLVDAQINVELPPYHPNCACSFVEWEEQEDKNEQEDQDEI